MAVLHTILLAGSLIFGTPPDTLRVARSEILLRVRDRSPIIAAQREEANALRYDAENAGLAANPDINAEFPLYTRSLGTWFDLTRNGQFSAAISQQLPIAGVRSAEAGSLRSQAEAADEIARQQTQFVLRDAAAEYTTLVYARRTLDALSHQLELLRPIIDGMRTQLERGNVAMKDLLRIQAAAYAIDQDRAEALRTASAAETRLRSLAGVDGPLLPTDAPTSVNVPAWLVGLSMDSLIQRAMINRADVMAAAFDVRAAEQARLATYRRAVPEPSVGVSYDKAGSYAPDFFGVTLSLPLPVINRQQWASEAAEARVRAAKARLERVRRAVETDVRNAVDRWRSLSQQRASVDPQFLKRTIDLTDNIIENYRKGNVSLLEFVDFIETYNESIIRQNVIDAQYSNALDDARIAIGEDLLATP
ncbi:MAG: TolC family protein [Candidatus Kapabacteria bacterium]|nr:TolC family protein [Candidatus Kapabacteria bacterium]